MNADTGEVFVFTEDQLRLMIDHAPNQESVDELQLDRLLIGNHIELNSAGFATLCYLAARTWLGIKGEDRHAA